MVSSRLDYVFKKSFKENHTCSQPHPSDVDYDFYLPYSDAMASVGSNGAEVEFRVVDGTGYFYISAYNYGVESGIISVEVLSNSQ